MPECRVLQQCPFFNDKMGAMPSVAKMMKERFCLNDASKCARWVVRESGRPVPANLYPSDMAGATTYLSTGR